ncbi:MAG TPA: choice-of-anchor D domain-containing protein, partial [Candidatus Kapabacteria bacterium]|nr:choice-of-anchor D domain-containing protein [Candidatus Kapabacteria bacterium]
TLVNIIDNKTGSATTATLSIAGANSADFTIRSQKTVSLNAGELQSAVVRFTPSETGLESALLLINYQSYTDTINLYGTGLAVGLSYDPATIFYDSVAINQASRKSVTIVSTRSDTVTANISIIGADSSSFVVGVPTPITVPPGGVTFPVDFQPLQIDTSIARLVITPSIGLPDTIYLNGVGYISGGSVVTSYPSPLMFDTLVIGDSEIRSFTLYNSGANPVQIDFQIVGNDSLAFSVPGLTSPMTIPHGQTTVPIKFTPIQIEANNAAFQFSTQGGNPLLEQIEGYALPQTGVKEPGTPQSTALIRNYPNPFSAQTMISFAGVDGVRSIIVYDMLGREVADLSSQITWGNLSQQVVFDASKLPEGIYFYKVGLAGKVLVGQMILVK